MNLLQIKLIINDSTTIFPSKISCNGSSYFETWNVNWKNIAGLAAGSFSLEPVKLLYSYDGVTWNSLFTGYASETGLIRTYGQITNDSVSLDLIDPANYKGTKKKPSNTIILENFKVCDPNNTDISLLHFMANKIGISNFDCGLIDKTIQLVSLGEKTYWEEIQQLAECYKVDLHFDRDGALCFHSQIENNYQQQFKYDFNSDDYPCYEKIKEKYTKASGNVYTTSFDKYVASDENEIVFRSQENYDETTGFCNIEILPGETYPSEGVLNLNYQDVLTGEKYEYVDNLQNPSIGTDSNNNIYYANGNLELVSLNGEFGSDISLTQTLPDSAQIILKNNGTTTCIIKKFELRGKGFKKSSQIDVEQRISNVDEIDEKKVSIDGKYFSDYDTAKEILSLYLSEGKINSRDISITTKFIPGIEKGDFLYLNDNGQQVPCKIKSFSHSMNGSQIHTMRTTVEIEELIEFTPSISKVYESPNNTIPIGLPGEKGDKGDTGDTGPQGPQGSAGVDAIGLGYKLNHTSLSTPNDGEIYFHGFVNGVASNVDGWIDYDGDRISVTQSYINPNAAFEGFVFIPIAGGSVGLCYFDYLTEEFKNQSGDGVLAENSYLLIGYMKNSASEVTDYCELYNRAKALPLVKEQLIEAKSNGFQGKIGAYSDGPTLYVKGFDVFGRLIASYGYFYIGNERITVNEYSQVLVNDGRGYILFYGGVITFAKLIANSNSSNWVEFNDTSTVIDGSFYVIGAFNKSGNSISNINIFNPIVKQDYEQQYFMDILANGNLEDVNTWAAANGISSVFEKIAVLEAFVNKLFANDITVRNQIKSENFEDGTGAGFSLTEDGTLSARLAILKDIRIEIGDENDKLLWAQTGQAIGSKTISPVSSKRFPTSKYLSDYIYSVSYDGITGRNSGASLLNSLSLDSNTSMLYIDFAETTTVTFNLNYSTKWWFIPDSKQYLAINGTRVFTSTSSNKTYTATFSAGDYAEITTNSGGFEILPNAIQIAGNYSVIYTKSEGEYVFSEGTGGDPDYKNKYIDIHLKKLIQLDKYSPKTLIVSGTTIENTYTNVNGFYTLLQKTGFMYKVNTSSSSIYYKNAANTLAYISKTSDSITFTLENGTTRIYDCNGSTIDTSSEFSESYGWGEFYGTVALLSEERGIVCDSILPFKNSSNVINSTIGSLALPYKAVYADNLFGQGGQRQTSLSYFLGEDWASGTNYYNTTNRPVIIMAIVHCYGTGVGADILVNGSLKSRTDSQGGTTVFRTTIMAIVPAGEYFSISARGATVYPYIFW